MNVPQKALPLSCPEEKREPFFKKLLRATAAVAFWILVWYFCAKRVGLTVILPSPVVVLKRLAVMVPTAFFWQTIANSMVHIVGGFLLGSVTGCIFAVICRFVPPMESLTKPLLITVKSTPVASFILLAWFWIAPASIPMFIAFLMVLPIVWISVLEGLKSMDPKLKEVAKVYRFSVWKTFRLYTVPQIMGHFSAAEKTSLGLAFKAGIAAEVICTPQNTIGRYLHDGKIYLQTEDVFAWTVVVLIISFLLEGIMTLLLHRVKGGERV